MILCIIRLFKNVFLALSVSAFIAQWLEPWPSNPAGVGSSPGRGGQVPARLRSR